MWSQPAFGKNDVETGGATTLYPMMLESPELRWPFIRKIYSIVAVQLLLTVAVGAFVVSYHPIVRFLTTTGLAVYIVLIITPFIKLCPLYYYHQRHPVNYVLLAIFTASLAFAIGLTCAFTSDDDDGLNYSSDLKKKKKKMKKASDKKIKISVSDSSSKTSDRKKKYKETRIASLVFDTRHLRIYLLTTIQHNKKVKKVSSNKKRKGTELPEAETTEVVVSTIPEDAHESKSSVGRRDKKSSKSKKKKRDKESRKKDSARENVSHSNDAGQQSGNLKSTSQIDNAATLFEDEDEVYEMSSGNEDETTGMKRWITKYHRARPGVEVLMENINDFLVDYAAQKEREKKEREEEAAEGGWTVVTHIKGRKKTTEAESGTTVGSVAPAAVMDKLSKKKDKPVGLNLYRFQKREAQRNEIMMLQSKFEQDKKRIQELRAARKFRPY